MRYQSLVMASIFLAATAFAKEPKAYQSGKLLQMDSVQCGVEEKDAKNFTGEVVGADSGHNKTQALLCQEYVLQTDQTIYRIRPKAAKHPALLPIGERAQFRLEKNKFLLRLESVDNKEHEYVVVSMKPLSQSTADASPAHLNHLQ